MPSSGRCGSNVDQRTRFYHLADFASTCLLPCSLLARCSRKRSIACTQHSATMMRITGAHFDASLHRHFSATMNLCTRRCFVAALCVATLALRPDPGFAVGARTFGRTKPADSLKFCGRAFGHSQRKAVLALYPSKSRYPRTPWTTAILLMTVISLLSTHNVYVRYALSWLKKMAERFTPPSCGFVFALQSSAAFTDSMPFAPALCLTMLLGRAVEGTMGGPVLFSSYVLAFFLTPIAASSCSMSFPTGTSHAVSACVLFVLFLATTRIFCISSVKNAEPLPGCTSITFWTNRWRLFRSLILGQFLLTSVWAVFAGQPGSLLALVGLGAFFPWIVWKRFLDDGSSKLDLKKKGDEFVNAVDGWFQSQESQVDTALKVADTAADLVLCSNGASQIFTFSSTTSHFNWLHAVISSFRVSFPSLSCAILLLMLFARAVELELGPSATMLAYVMGGVCTNLFCYLTMVRTPVGLPFAGSIFALVFLALGATLKHTLRLRSLKALRQSLQRLDVERCLEAVILIYFVTVWAAGNFPSTLVVVKPFRSSRIPLLSIPWVSGWLIAVFGGAIGALSCVVSCGSSLLHPWRRHRCSRSFQSCSWSLKAWLADIIQHQVVSRALIFQERCSFYFLTGYQSHVQLHCFSDGMAPTFSTSLQQQ
eukprot:symbB.v1.2.019876.t1/scaffold1648.1/size107735/2